MFQLARAESARVHGNPPFRDYCSRECITKAFSRFLEKERITEDGK